jgi:hypothetical protein
MSWIDVFLSPQSLFECCRIFIGNGLGPSFDEPAPSDAVASNAAVFTN